MTEAGPLTDTLRVLGMLVVALLAAAAVVAPSVRARAVAMLGALVLTPLLLVAEIWQTPQLEALRERPVVALVALGAAVLASGALAWLFHRRPALVALVAVGALPVRVPVDVGGATANLLFPLYVVIGAAVLAWAVPRLRGAAPARDVPVRALEWLLVGSVVLYALQSAYSADVAKALEQVVFFYVPFALLFALLREVPWTRQLVWRCVVVLLALALVFVVIGYWEYATRQLLLNPKVIASNQFEEAFRVNSLFFDPNIYGRFLAVVILLLSAMMLWSRRPPVVLAGAVALALLWGGLVLTLSQSSFAALLAGLAVLALLRWRARWTLGAIAIGVVAAVAVVVASPATFGVSEERSIDDATSGRARLVEGGLDLARMAPLAGHGAGSFSRAYRREQRAGAQQAVSASHTIPVTVAAEQGVIGLAVYLALLVAALHRLLRRAGHVAARAAVGAAFVALVAHTWTYAAFLEDPLTWVLLGAGTALAVALPARRPRPPAPRAPVAA